MPTQYCTDRAVTISARPSPSRSPETNQLPA
ncbi:MAG: hypothetical protein HPY44_14000 [Armatimonadetes bacterium]|nr:hypothetical protein [Armatimonadota bacterium]